MEHVARRRVLPLVVLASIAVGCASVPMHAGDAGPYPDPSLRAQGAILGGLAGAAVGAGLDHRHRGRGALVGGLGGLIVGAVFGEQLERHAAWHRWHEAEAYGPPHGHGAEETHGPWCDGRHAWEDEHAWEDDDGWEDEHAWEDDDGWEDDHAREVPETHEVPAPASWVGPPEVLFDPGSATLTRGAEARLRHLARQVRATDDVELLLRGHSDEQERDGFDLSEARARAVRAFLAEEGVSVRRIAWVGFGDTQPVASNETAAGRQRNRRVEIVLREPESDPYS